MVQYAVIDLETTGFSPAQHHRVIEAAIVVLDEQGTILSEWDSLINPQRHVGATEIHGITAGELYHAPTFGEVAGQIAHLLRGRVPASHNFSFDGTFLAAEFERVGTPVPICRDGGLCTMRLSSRYLPQSARNLESCCSAIGYQSSCMHAALPDARAAAHLLAHFLHDDCQFTQNWSDPISTATQAIWPTFPECACRRISRANGPPKSRDHFLSRLVMRSVLPPGHGNEASYFGLLDRVLLDRQISHHEEDELISAAEMLGLTREDALSLHWHYLCALSAAAMADGVITVEEHADLVLVAGVLGLAATDVDRALTESDQRELLPATLNDFCLNAGDAIVFTGEAPGVERSELEVCATAAGLKVTGSVSKKTRLLIASDPDSLSGKARKARDLGVPIVDYAAYQRLLATIR